MIRGSRIEEQNSRKAREKRGAIGASWEGSQTHLDDFDEDNATYDNPAGSAEEENGDDAAYRNTVGEFGKVTYAALTKSPAGETGETVVPVFKSVNPSSTSQDEEMEVVDENDESDWEEVSTEEIHAPRSISVWVYRGEELGGCGLLYAICGRRYDGVLVPSSASIHCCLRTICSKANPEKDHLKAAVVVGF